MIHHRSAPSRSVKRPVLRTMYGRPRWSATDSAHRTTSAAAIVPSTNDSPASKKPLTWSTVTGHLPWVAGPPRDRRPRGEVQLERRLGRGVHADRGHDVGLAIGGPGEVLVDGRRGATAGGDGLDDRARSGHHVAAGEDPGAAGRERARVRDDPRP